MNNVIQFPKKRSYINPNEDVQAKIDRIKASLERINDLMSKLKEISKVNENNTDNRITPMDKYINNEILVLNKKTSKLTTIERD